jgi:hypothetical protein
VGFDENSRNTTSFQILVALKKVKVDLWDLATKNLKYWQGIKGDGIKGSRIVWVKFIRGHYWRGERKIKEFGKCETKISRLEGEKMEDKE